MASGLPLRTRRFRARGIGTRVQNAWAPRWFHGIGNRATLTTSMTGVNNDIFLMAKVPGTTGNAITLTIVVAGASTPLSVSVTGSAITVNSATNSSSAAISTAKDVTSAIRFFPAASLLVHANVAAPGNDGTGVVTALSATALTSAV